MRKHIYIRDEDKAVFEEAAQYADGEALGVIVARNLREWVEAEKARREGYQLYKVTPIRENEPSEYDDFHWGAHRYVGRPVEFVGRILARDLHEPAQTGEPASTIYETRGGTIVVEQQILYWEGLLMRPGDTSPYTEEDYFWVQYPEINRVAWFEKLDDIPTEEEDLAGYLTETVEDHVSKTEFRPNKNAVRPPECPELRTLDDVKKHGAVVAYTGEVLWEYKAADGSPDIVVVPKRIVEAARLRLGQVEPIRLD